MARDLILIADMGGSEVQHIARSVRNAGVYCEIVPVEGLSGRAASGLILAGGDGELPQELLGQEIPILALGDASGVLLRAYGGSVGAFMIQDQVVAVKYREAPIFENIEDGMRRVGRACSVVLPNGWQAIAEAGETPLAFSDAAGTRIGLQFLPERNDLDGYQILSNFVHIICGCDFDWNTEAFMESAIEGLRNRVGDGIALCPMTGGVDSAVSATLAYKALGERAVCLFVDTGLTGEGQAERFERMFIEEIGIPIRRIAAGNRFMLRLEGITEPGKKRLAVADEFNRIILEQRHKLDSEKFFFVQGTIYNDILYPSEHQVTLRNPGIDEGVVTLEPLRSLFKFEVRQLGERLGLPGDIVNSQPYPGAGLAVRCMGEVTPQRVGMLRKADAIFRRIVQESGAEKSLSQYFAVMTDLKSLNSKGGRTGAVILLRAVMNRQAGTASPARLSYDMLEACVAEILKEVPGIDRILYDITPKPPAEIELE